MVAETSRQAYRSIKKLGDKQQSVYNAIEEMGVASNEMVADYLGWPINRVTGRVTELHSFGVVGIERLGRSKSGRPAKMWSIRNPYDRKISNMTLELDDGCAN